MGDLAERIERDQDRIDVLVNNAGIGSTLPGDGRRMESRDGHELRFAVNYLAHFLLTRRLAPLIRASAPARIVNVTSAGQAAIDFDDVMLERAYDGTRAYCQSKLAQIMFTFDLADELRDAGGHRQLPAPGDLHADQDRHARGRRSQHARGGRSRRPCGWRQTPSSRGSRAATSTGRRGSAPTRRPTTRTPGAAAGAQRGAGRPRTLSPPPTAFAPARVKRASGRDL